MNIAIPSATLGRFWSMIAHYHGQIWNGAEFARSFALSETTIRRWLDVLAGTFMVRILQPWSENIGKRQVKAPKVYVRDSGIFHALLALDSRGALESHPKLGASFEGFALQETIRQLRASPHECYFWATHQGAELDLLVVRGRKRLGFEFKRTDAPAVTKSTKIALEDLKLDSLDIVHVGDETYPLTERVRAVAITRLRQDLKPLR
jgi:predicted AAA+ superfamily ATPase